jgi:inhibitor of KinA
LNLSSSYTIFPLGDSAITIDFGNTIDESVNRKVMSLFCQLKKHAFTGMIEAVPAYSSLTIHYNVPAVKKIAKDQLAYDWVKTNIETFIIQNEGEPESKSRLMRIPVCYDKEYGYDLDAIAFTKKLSIEEIIQLHTAETYKVYLLGFLPGFPYMATLNEKLTMPRRSQPRLSLPAGSVGIAGRQTGIYPLDSPGGWQIVGRTPLQMFNAHDENPTLLRVGDTIQFHSITADEFKDHQGRHS